MKIRASAPYRSVTKSLVNVGPCDFKLHAKVSGNYCQGSIHHVHSGDTPDNRASLCTYTDSPDSISFLHSLRAATPPPSAYLSRAPPLFPNQIVRVLSTIFVSFGRYPKRSRVHSWLTGSLQPVDSPVLRFIGRRAILSRRDAWIFVTTGPAIATSESRGKCSTRDTRAEADETLR